MIVVYTTIFGGSDSLKPAPTGADRCVCFVDDRSAYPDAMGWELRQIPSVVLRVNQAKQDHWVGAEWGGGDVFTALSDPRRKAWWARCVPRLLFPDADRTVWIDASFTLVDLPLLLEHAGGAPVSALRHHTRNSCYQEGKAIVKTGQAPAASVMQQMAQYTSEGFIPPHLSISCVLVRDRSAEKFNETWDEQIRTYPGDNTQLSLDYAAWKHGLTIRGLQGTRHTNPYAVHDHADHKLRRRPYDTEAAA